MLLPAERAGSLFGISVEAWVLFATLLVLIWQTAGARREMRQAAIRNIYDRYMEIGKLEVVHPELHKMFMDADTLAATTEMLSPEDLKLRALALLVLDQFALIFNLGERRSGLYRLDPMIRRLPDRSPIRHWWAAYADRHRTVFDINKDYIAAVVKNPMVRRAWAELGLGVTWKGSMFYDFVERCLAEDERVTPRLSGGSTSSAGRPNGPTARVQQVYDGCASEYASVFFNDETVAVDIPYLVQVCRQTPRGGVVLDVGCGPGLHAGFFDSRDYTYIGCDLSAEMIQLARQRNQSGVFVVADALMLPFGSETIDACLALESLIHLDSEQFGDALVQIHQCLRQGAPLLLGLQLAPVSDDVSTVPYPLGQKEMIPVRFVTELTITSELKRTGFEVVWVRRRNALPGELESGKVHVLCRRSGGEYVGAEPGVWT